MGPGGVPAFGEAGEGFEEVEQAGEEQGLVGVLRGLGLGVRAQLRRDGGEPGSERGMGTQGHAAVITNC